MSEKKESFREEMRKVNVDDVFDKGTPPAPTQEKTKEEKKVTPPVAEKKPKNYEEAINSFKPSDIIDKDGKLYKNKVKEAERKKQKAEKEAGKTKDSVLEIKSYIDELKKEIQELKNNPNSVTKTDTPKEDIENDDIDESLMYSNPREYKRLLQEKMKKQFEKENKPQEKEPEQTNVEKTKEELVGQIKEAVDVFGDKFNINSDDFIDYKENFKVSDAVVLKHFKNGNITDLLSEKDINKIVERFLNSDSEKNKNRPPFNLTKSGEPPLPDGKKLGYDVKKGFKSKEVEKLIYDAFEGLSGEIK